MPSIDPRLLQLLQRLKPSSAGMNRYVNPWHPTGNIALDAGKSLAAAGAAAIPLTAGINRGVYGGMMGRHFTGPDGKEVPGLDPTSKFTEYMSNVALSLPFLNRRMFKHIYPTLGTSLAAKGMITLGIPSITDISKSTQNTSRATGEIANTASNLSSITSGIENAAPAIRDAVKAMQANRDWATPFITGGIGAAAGNLAGRFFESEGKTTTAEKNKQKRNRILLTLLGAGGGALAGSRSSQGLPPLMPTNDEWKNVTGTVRGGVDSVKNWAAGLGKQAASNDLVTSMLLQAMKARTQMGEQGGPGGATAKALQEMQNPDAVQTEINNQMLTRGIGMPVGGAAAGAGIGALIQHLRGRGKSEKDKPSMGTGAVLGGLAGGLLGTAGLVDVPRQSWNASATGRSMGTIPFTDGLQGIARIVLGQRPDDVIPEAVQRAIKNKWQPAN